MQTKLILFTFPFFYLQFIKNKKTPNQDLVKVCLVSAFF